MREVVDGELVGPQGGDSGRHRGGVRARDTDIRGSTRSPRVNLDDDSNITDNEDSGPAPTTIAVYLDRCHLAAGHDDSSHHGTSLLLDRQTRHAAARHSA